MKGIHTFLPVLTALAALAFSDGRLSAGDLYNKDTARGDEVALPKPADVQRLAVYPAKIQLKGSDDAQQLILTATLKDKRLQDLSGDVKYAAADSKVVRV